MLISTRIGHLATNSELFLRRRTAGKIPADDFIIAYCINDLIANRQLLEMIRRRMFVLKHPLWDEFVKRGLKAYIEGTRFHVNFPCKCNEYEEFDTIAPQLSFTAGEMEKGRRLLSDIGIGAAEPFVCFHARDSAYLDSAFSYKSREQWSYHDFRDSDIQNYVPAAEFLSSRGLRPVRMGAVVSKPIRTDDHRIVDYAVKHRTDFGDIFLSAHCKFFLSGTGGVERVAMIFGVPMATANATPFGLVSGWRSCDLFIVKKFWHREKGRILRFREIMELGMDRCDKSDQFERGGIDLIENTAEEITDLAFEMNARLDRTWECAAEDDELQNRFRALFPPGHPTHGFPSRIGALFMRKNRELMD